MSHQEKIVIKGAREHNLKNINVEIPREKLTVLTGLSGSGKSSLAFDTLYAEGQRRYVESLSAYARQFLEQMQKPDVDFIGGLSPAISIDQKAPSRNPRSTVGTVTEIYDYLRLLFANCGIPHCPKCGRMIKRQTVQEIVDNIFKKFSGQSIEIFSPVIRGKKGEYKDLLSSIKKDGFLKVRLDNKVFSLEEEIKINKKLKHNLDIVVDRLTAKDTAKNRITQSIETALKYGSGLVFVNDKLYSEKFACPHCDISLDEITPRIFSFNSPYGACPHCSGLGSKLEFDEDFVIPDKNLSLNEGAIAPWNNAATYYMQKLGAVAEKYGFSLDTPVNKLTRRQLDIILYGTGEEKVKYKYVMQSGFWEHEGKFEGVINNLRRRYIETKSENMRYSLYRFMSANSCKVCEGTRLKPESLAVKIAGLNIAQVSALAVENLRNFLVTIEWDEKQTIISRPILKELNSRLKFLEDVGLNYIAISREASTLSGGEAQRTRLATQIGSGLTGVLYILDEPSIGLHQKDNAQLIKTLFNLRDLGNTIVVVEHDQETILAADHVIDIGPGAGIHGGKIIAEGTPAQILKAENSLTGQYLSGKMKIEVPQQRRKDTKKYLSLTGCQHNNLKNLTVKIPLASFTVVSGVSGSGKSSLIIDTLYNALAKKIYRKIEKAGKHKEIKGFENIEKIIMIDQSPIGRTPRSNPATYTGVFSPIRDLFSQTQEAKIRGYQPGRFSFNVKGGRCEACGGDGLVKIEMHFLPDVYVPCDVCKSQRYNRETLEVYYKGKNIFEVLNMTVEEALTFFENVPFVERKLRTLYDVGLGYIKLGQSATTLSGGEAQRVKLATELSLSSRGKNLYLLDEPTTGLHFDDVKKLLVVLNRLVDQGNTVLVIEHNLEVIKVSDYVIDMGPEGGDKGGEIIVCGTPEEVAQCGFSYTGKHLKKVLKY